MPTAEEIRLPTPEELELASRIIQTYRVLRACEDMSYALDGEANETADLIIKNERMWPQIHTYVGLEPSGLLGRCDECQRLITIERQNASHKQDMCSDCWKPFPT